MGGSMLLIIKKFQGNWSQSHAYLVTLSAASQYIYILQGSGWAMKVYKKKKIAPRTCHLENNENNNPGV